MAGVLYTKTHEWVKVKGDVATIGLTDYAQGELGDIVFVEMPEVGTELSTGDSVGTIESVKTVSDYYSPVTGEIVEVNDNLEDAPETINEDPSGEGWIYRVKLEDKDELEDLMDESDYKQYLKKLQEEEE
ncbi:MAG: glycine cleavage system protein GcvH [Candidatus Muiribacteriota bacterium]